VLALAGHGFVVISVVLLVMYRPQSVLQGPSLGGRITTEIAFLVIGVGFILAGWHFFRLDVDKPDEVQDRPPSRFAPYFIAHRHELKGLRK